MTDVFICIYICAYIWMGIYSEINVDKCVSIYNWEANYIRCMHTKL